MARAISADALDNIAAGARYDTHLTITLPDAQPIGVLVSPSWSVPEKSVITGQRLSVSSLPLLPWTSDPIPGNDLFAFAGYPGAVYDLYIGIILGSTTEWVQVFSGRVVEGSSRRNSLGVTVSLVDGWSWSDRVPLSEAFTTTVNVARATTIIDLLTPAAVGFDTDIRDMGGYLTVAGTYTDSRGQAAEAIATDGLLQAGFDGTGALVVKAQFDADAAVPAPDWMFRTDQDATLNAPPAPSYPATIIDGSLERTRPWSEALINAVTVKPGGSEQTWTAQTATILDTADPRHPDRVGLRPAEITSDTIDNSCDAFLLAESELNRRLRFTNETVKLQILLNPAVEADDIFGVFALPTLDDAGWSGLYVATSVTHAPSAGITSIEGASATTAIAPAAADDVSAADDGSSGGWGFGGWGFGGWGI